ncbi:MAG TPA: ATPase, T2SS/T4P/T4SS family, partial [Thermoanaerobaculia bacterium]|nr:ATPase, T2SS/T4P/T4SS family [Thermoanaerobaculia bacterium]
MTRRYPPTLVEMLREEMTAAGLLAPLADPETTDLMVNADGSVWLQHLARGHVALDGEVAADRLESLLGTVASLTGAVINAERPILEATLPFHEARLEAVLPPLSTAPLVAIRKPPARLLALDDLVANGTLPGELAERLAAAVRARRTCAVAGGVGSGKTTLVNALLAAILAAEPDERVVILEEGARELHAEGANVLRLLTSDAAGVGMTELLRAALRLNPSRILVGEA